MSLVADLLPPSEFGVGLKSNRTRLSSLVPPLPFARRPTSLEYPLRTGVLAEHPGVRRSPGFGDVVYSAYLQLVSPRWIERNNRARDSEKEHQIADTDAVKPSRPRMTGSCLRCVEQYLPPFVVPSHTRRQRRVRHPSETTPNKGGALTQPSSREQSECWHHIF